jgi:plastocyanin
MKFRNGGYILMAAGLAFLLAGCGKKEEQPAETAAPAQTGGQQVDASTAGSISGTVKLDGPAPKMSKISMAADTFCASQHPAPVMAQDVVTGPGGTLANVVVYISDDMSKYSFPTPSSPATIDQKGCMYSPHVVVMMAGQTLQVNNDDQTTHNIHPVPKDNREWNESQPPGAQPIMKVFARPEDAIPVKCNVHPWMKSYIFVFKNPYYSVTASDGKYTISNLPPGTYTVTAWQERYGTVTQSVTVGAKESKTQDLSFKASAAGAD